MDQSREHGRLAPVPSYFLTLALLFGCAQTRLDWPAIGKTPAAPVGGIERTAPGPTSMKPVVARGEPADPMVKRSQVSRPEVGPTRAAELPRGEPALPRSEAASIPRLAPPDPSLPGPPGLPAVTDQHDAAAGGPVPLRQAIEMAFRAQPRLRVYLEGIQQARSQSGLAFAPFLPVLGTAYSVGGFDLSVGGSPLKLGGGPGFTVLPPGFALPVGLHLNTGYELAEARLQWLICDFGRRLGRYEASKLAIDITQLQTDRAFQTVANEVAVAYYTVLRVQALRRIAVEAVRRAEDELAVARKLARGGVLEREKVLRAEVLSAEAHRGLDVAEESYFVAAAALTLAIGLKANAAIAVVEPPVAPLYRPSLAECLDTAIRQRREFQVARRSIEIAQENSRVAKAAFAPRIVSEGQLLDLQQSSPRGHADVALGFIRLEWVPFEGGRRVAEQRLTDSKIREAAAQAESIADTIAFQVSEAYRRLVTAKLGIDRARPAVDQAQENYRLVRERARQGDATPVEVTDAETSLTRAQENSLNSNYDYLIAIARLEYAMGVTVTPESLHCEGR